MSKSHLILTFLLIHQQPTIARAVPANYSINRINCILHNYPTKEYCDEHFPNRKAAKIYHENQQSIGCVYMLFLVTIFVMFFCNC